MMIREQLTQEIIAKKKSKQKLNEQKVKCLVAIYKGVKYGKTIREIHKDLYKSTINGKMLVASLKLAKQFKVKADTETKKVENKEMQGILFFTLFTELALEKKLSKLVNEEIREQENTSKEKILKKSIETQREQAKVFYLASKHSDCAEDHEEAQGKIYIDEEWRKIITDTKEQRAISKYIRKHKTQTIQYITGRPVWFITRPNCRHYFIELSNDEVLKNTYVGKYDNETPIGDRAYLQTYNHPKKREWYDNIRNAEILLEKYKERLWLHKELQKWDTQNILLKRAVEKDKLLIKKWSDYIASRKNVL